MPPANHHTTSLCVSASLHLLLVLALPAAGRRVGRSLWCSPPPLLLRLRSLASHTHLLFSLLHFGRGASFGKADKGFRFENRGQQKRFLALFWRHSSFVLAAFWSCSEEFRSRWLVIRRSVTSIKRKIGKGDSNPGLLARKANMPPAAPAVHQLPSVWNAMMNARFLGAWGILTLK